MSLRQERKDMAEKYKAEVYIGRKFIAKGGVDFDPDYICQNSGDVDPDKFGEFLHSVPAPGTDLQVGAQTMVRGDGKKEFKFTIEGDQGFYLQIDFAPVIDWQYYVLPKYSNGLFYQKSKALGRFMDSHEAHAFAQQLTEQDGMTYVVRKWEWMVDDE